ncbi:hypothetical protein [Enterococcus sp. CWB-B31]|uniref:hypothetical protein n=1 Tax=Enterococcus sp. CWB-B31 TaxID=2885159 RepID=UPI001E57EFC3|nr:hypothetical protein [Enterococcus sp. CWB-B31]MCB5954978.1 hypothetical protein [Enterococcus sp. CWB-B31]
MYVKKIIRACLTAAAGLVISGCSQTPVSTADKTLPENETAFTWWADRSEPFGNYEYAVTNESEALTALADKFELELLPSFDKAREIMIEDFLIEGTEQEAEEFSFNAYNSTLTFSSKIKFKNEEKYTSYGTVAAKYQYIETLGKVKLASQKIDIYNDLSDEKFYGADLNHTLRQLGELMELKELDRLLEEFAIQTADTGTLKGKDIVIYEDYQEGQKARLFGKSFGVKYDIEGTLEKIYAYTMDYRL